MSRLVYWFNRFDNKLARATACVRFLIHCVFQPPSSSSLFVFLSPPPAECAFSFQNKSFLFLSAIHRSPPARSNVRGPSVDLPYGEVFKLPRILINWAPGSAGRSMHLNARAWFLFVCLASNVSQFGRLSTQMREHMVYRS